MNKVAPLKKFGQNFLVDNNIILKIINEISPTMDDNFVEIGPGQGALTKHLIEKSKSLTAVEIDKRVIEDLTESYPALKIINQDILKINFADLEATKESKIRVAGNIPYNITSPIVFKLIENRKFIKDAVLMVQYEVARRFVANKDTKDYGILAVLLQYFADVKFCFKVSPNVFFPKPKINSAIVHFRFNKRDNVNLDEKQFIKVVKAAFGNRRKTLKNSLSNSIFNTCNFENSPVDLSKRAEQLTINDFIILTQFLSEQINVRS
ncbi:MAG: 16S rRNA (adenine(1518)-N(6)/adenine(1519)-N(6))-dimethyltransferase RsmA [Melioribacteraceae bacterium]|nr:16S rRNA (adenine(1518)-N(6)/adenine(1519)-N(6))-dimethyltransferase RsmA [Melioribacteraceae bacterium]